ncbi:MAG: tetratricopeptide repeat protein, partial [Nitrospinaceae bacterium]|nr:tetratricopeptide repeat protein [Nitrospinaceae bacterium]NIR54217.1 tetratricopeptide repeat protein [Nitrospinaceae bacterium]NIS84632.1 tetratricopeptide repeat protein [Nitrospinaceae bacterium]NIT81427.1 tetratricopeptide repeat protein [Nitrospinaceae bacterium]NIU43710.1 tetratricopeptide repeat protein [Nitrospinaceae bacterium]
YYLGEFEAAKKAFEKALSLDETHLEAAYQLAYLHAAQKDPKKSKEYIYHILESRREHPKVQSAKVLLDYIGKGELDKLPLDIDPAEYHLSRSKALYQSGQYGLSFIEVQTAAGLDPKNLKTLEILVGMCSILLRL